MPKIILLNLSTFIFLLAVSQKISIANEKFNIFYAGVDNPVSIAVENTSSKNLIVKTTNGTIRKEQGSYVFHADSIGITHIIIYTKSGNKLKEIGREAFRVRAIPAPVFKIGSGKKKVSKAEIAAQDFVRAELEHIDIDVRFTIKNFSVLIISNDNCSAKHLQNSGNKINDEMKAAFKNLKNEDTVLFKDIFIEGSNTEMIKLDDVVITIIAK